MPKRQLSINLEKSLQNLEEIVVQLERGDLSLEDSLKYFERGVALTRSCQQALAEAEQKISILQGEQLQPFHTEEHTDAT